MINSVTTKEQDVNLAQLQENYLVFLEALCDNADPAAVFDLELVRLSRSTADAADAARFEVCLEFFAIRLPPFIEINKGRTFVLHDIILM